MELTCSPGLKWRERKLWQYLKCGCVFLDGTATICVSHRFKWRNTHLQPSLTAWGLHSVGLLPGEWREDSLIIRTVMIQWSFVRRTQLPLKFLFIQHLYHYFSHALSLSAPVLWQHRCRHPSSTQSPPESRPPHPLSAPFVWLHPWELCPGRAGPAGKNSAAAVPASRGPAGQMVFNTITTTYAVLTLSPNC